MPCFDAMWQLLERSDGDRVIKTWWNTYLCMSVDVLYAYECIHVVGFLFQVCIVCIATISPPKLQRQAESWMKNRTFCHLSHSAKSFLVQITLQNFFTRNGNFRTYCTAWEMCLVHWVDWSFVYWMDDRKVVTFGTFWTVGFGGVVWGVSFHSRAWRPKMLP